MKKYSPVFNTVIILFLSWALPLYGVIYNQIFPSYQSALGVPFGFLFGCVVHFFMLILWIVIRRSKLQKRELSTLLVSFSVMVMLAVVSDGGSLSKMRV